MKSFRVIHKLMVNLPLAVVTCVTGEVEPPSPAPVLAESQNSYLPFSTRPLTSTAPPNPAPFMFSASARLICLLVGWPLLEKDDGYFINLRLFDDMPTKVYLMFPKFGVKTSPSCFPVVESVENYISIRFFRRQPTDENRFCCRGYCFHVCRWSGNYKQYNIWF